MIKAEVIWAAGFFDGEGCVSIARHKSGNHAIVVVGQVEPGPLHRFQSALGIGRIYGPYSRGGNRTPAYRWQAAALDDVIMVRDLLYPHLCDPAKRKFDDALSEDTRIGAHRGRGGWKRNDNERSAT